MSRIESLGILPRLSANPGVARRGHLRRKDAKLIRQWVRTAEVTNVFGSPSGAFVD